MATADGDVDWSKLPSDLWCLIGKKLDFAADRVRFGAVCKSWRSLLPYRQPPWLMLAEPHSHDKLILIEPLTPPPPRGFVIVGEQHVYHFHLPQSAHQARCAGSTGNWLILIDLEKMIRLLNPFSGVQIDLPSQTTFQFGLLEGDDDVDDIPPEEHRDLLLKKVILSPSPSPSGNVRDCIAMAIHHYLGKLAFARPGDASWTIVETPSLYLYVRDVIFYKHQFYAVSFNGGLLVCDLGDDAALHSPNPKASLIADPLSSDRYKEIDLKLYLVECSGELLLAIKFVQNIQQYKTYKFEIYKLDFASKKWIALKNLGEYSLFLGFNTSVSLLASDYYKSVKKNCIYFTDDFVLGYRGNESAGGHDMGIYHLDDGSIEPHYKGSSTSLYSPPIWIVPSFSAGGYDPTFKDLPQCLRI